MATAISMIITLIGFSISALFIFYIFIRFICVRFQLSFTSPFSHFSHMEREMNGLEPVMAASFPVNEFGDDVFSGQDYQCTVCLTDYKKDDILRILPVCTHTFHLVCIDQWLKQHSTCPICRVSIRENFGRKLLLTTLLNEPLDRPFNSYGAGTDAATSITVNN